MCQHIVCGGGKHLMPNYNKEAANRWFKEVEAEYRRRTPASRAAFERVRGIIPGGVPGGLNSIQPYPLYATHARGAYLWDADGNKYFDAMGGDWVYALGHCVPEILEATIEQAKRSTTFCTPDVTLGYELATLIQTHIPSMERMRFTTSGTESTLAALRLARAFTGRGTIAKMRGGFHGTHDSVLIDNGRFLPENFVHPGLIPDTERHVVLLPYNDPDACTRIIAEHAKDLAAVIVEPMLGAGGMIPANAEFLRALRDVTETNGIVLIFDEMVTFPVGPHGYQGIVGITPDMTTLGKTVSGGVPLGVFGGRSDIMSLIDSVTDPTSTFRHGSTLGGTPLALASGKAAVEQFTPAVYERLESMGDRFRRGVDDIATRLDVPIQATGYAHMFGLHFTETNVVDVDSANKSDREVIFRLLLNAINEGSLVFLAGVGTIMASATDDDVDGLLIAIEKGLRDGYATIS